ncbi:MAG TPA: ABC transporter ATP-binding protein [Propionibacteriaceae bacterium]|nr:ABC transporter ATP-binding protein [Propionibacteriaceae bacterium]
MREIDPMDLATPAEDQRKSVGRLTRLMARSVSMVWQSARTPFLALIGLQLLNAIALALQVAAVQLALTAVLALTGSTGDLWRLVQPVLLLAGLAAATAVIASVQVGLGRYTGELVVAVMWKRVLRVATRVDLRKFESARFYDRLQRVQANALTRPYQITYGLLATMGALAASAALVIAIVLVHPALLPLLLVGGVPVLLTSRRQSQLEFAFLTRQTESMRLRTYLTWVQTGRDEAKEVRAYGLAHNFGQRLNTLYADYLRDLAQHVSHRSRLGAVGSLGSAALLALTLFLLAWLISTSRLSIAEAGTALVAIRLLASQVQSGFTGAQAIFESGMFIDDLDGFLTLAPAAEGGSREIAPPTDFHRIRADAVSFSYPGRSALALQAASIEINRGEVVALVGENGSGKTTLAKVMAGLYEPGSGAVRWDGTDVRTFRPDLFRERVAIIFQDFVRYALSAEENIAVARPDNEIDHAAVREAAKIADADSFLSSLPAGYQTPLSRQFTGGHELSGGQWQKVAIARAFYRNAPLVIIDEPTAALDARAEYELFSSLHEVLRGRSALIISHRFSTVRTADRIYVLDHGRVVEQGTHDELVALGGQYAELFHLQASAYSVDSVMD